MRIPILTFHSLDEAASPLSFPPSLFRRGIERLHRAGVCAVTVSDAARLLHDGRPDARPDRLMAIRQRARMGQCGLAAFEERWTPEAHMSRYLAIIDELKQPAV